MFVFEVTKQTDILFINEIMPLQDPETWNKVSRNAESVGIGRRSQGAGGKGEMKGRKAIRKWKRKPN